MRSKLLFLPIALLCLQICQLGCASEEPTDYLRTPPSSEGVVLSVANSQILVVNAQINGQSANVLIDTGAPINFAPPEAISRFELHEDGNNSFAGEFSSGIGVCQVDSPTVIEDHVYLLSHLEFAEVAFENVSFSILDEGVFSTFEELDVALIIGAGLVQQLDWMVSDFGEQLTLFPADNRSRPASAVNLLSFGQTVMSIEQPWGFF